MDKREILKDKLINIIDHVDSMNVCNEATMHHLTLFKKYVNDLITSINNNRLENSNGALLGLIRGISDYDELCSDEILWSLVTDADNYYCKECKTFL